MDAPPRGRIELLLIAFLLSALQEASLADEEFSPEDWLRARSLGVLATVTPQSGKPLLPVGAQSIDEWQTERVLYERAYRELIGGWPLVRDELKALVLESTQHENKWIRYKVSFTSIPCGAAHAEEIRAWFFVPIHATRPLPAIVTLHQTFACGKDEPAGIQSSVPWLAFASYYAERGYATLAPDMIGFGERTAGGYARTGFELEDARPILDKHTQMTLLGLMLFDVSRCVDFLRTRSEIDPERIGVMGHSLGGILVNCVLPLESRFRVGVASCGYGLFRTDADFDGRWAASNSAYLPRMFLYRDKRNELPLDFHHILALSAPRPHLVQTAMGDTIWTLPGVSENKFVTSELRRIRQWYGKDATENFVPVEPANGATDRNHGWYPETQTAADALFEKILRER